MSNPENPLTPAQWEALDRLLEGVTPGQTVWLNGYLAGFSAARRLPGGFGATSQETGVARETTESTQPTKLAEKPEITVLFGSQTGNAEKLARVLRAQLVNAGFPARVEGMGSYKTSQLKRDNLILIIVSTYGEGDPPDNALAFHEFLLGKKAPKLDGTRFSVLALGDSSYEHFCKTGRDIDGRLAELGASRLLPRSDCDVDYEEAAEEWMENVLAKLQPIHEPQTDSVSGNPPNPPLLKGGNQVNPPLPKGGRGDFSKKNPYPAKLLENQRLTGRGSSKDVRHIELSIAGSGLSYEPGDSLGVVASNWPQRVAELVESLGLDGNDKVAGANGSETRLEQAFLNDYEITTLTRPFLEKYAHLSGSSELAGLLKEENKANLRDYLQGREIIDVVRAYPVPGLDASQFVPLLRKLQPRQYSIASSYKANPDEVHLTVAVVRYESHGLQRQGVASTFLADRVAEDGLVPVYVDSNPNFRLPQDPDTAIIMVGPGTGVAPFRAFLEERETVGAKGKNWLFFGDRNFNTDFLYQREWLEHRKNGLLTRIDVAFSRDTDEKVYVQHRLLENSRELYGWLQEGAYLYICGDANRMASDVHEALIQTVAKESGQTHEKAVEYVKALQADKRYQRDIY
ncbi:MAG: assimilatory sulfite reductase (NADPH) flavoprotein subunit [Proteobacteria bacterium]|nr:assimilatory sulfite reductase (NADPH) flavoprotein subunit [Pseudomonadota bacterium]